MTECLVVFGLTLVPVLLGLSAGRLSRAVLRALRPAPATILLTGYAVSVSLVTGLLLCLVAYLGTVELLPVLHPEDWAPSYLHDALPIPEPLAVTLGLLALVLLARALWHFGRVIAYARRASAAAADLPSADGLAMLEDEAVYACAVPGRHRRIVVSTGLLRRLDGAQRKALLAHEQAHLRYQHHRYAQLARIAAAANPLMRPVAHAVDGAIERWADAEAVREVGDSAIVARAIGVAALARSKNAPGGTFGTALGAGRSDVLERVRDLLQPPVRGGRAGWRLVAAMVLCWVCCVSLVIYVHDIVEVAEVFYYSTR